MRAPAPIALLLPVVLVGVAAGIAASGADVDAGLLLPLVVVAGVAIASAVVAAAGRLALGGLVVACTVAVVVGALRGAASGLPLGPGSVVGAVGGGEMEIVGTLADEPRPREDRFQLVLDDLTAAGRPLRGRLLAWVPRTIDLVPGDRLRIRAALEGPPPIEGFDYRAYLARQGIGAVARSFDVERLGHLSSGIADGLAGLRHALAGGLNDLVPEPEAAFGVGILLGIRTGIDPQLADAFAHAGLTHVVAISGWNIAIVTALAGAGLRPLRRRPGGRWTESAATVGVVTGYVILVGASASVVRAALMAGALLVARLGGSRGHAASALALAALVMLVAAPPLLWDVGFQLSALATAGLLAFAATIDRRLSSLPRLVREPVALTVSAQLATLPVVVASFERFSIVAPLANVLVVPLVPLVMAACAVAAPVGALLAPFGASVPVDLVNWLVGGLTWLPLRALTLAGQVTGTLPLASIEVHPPPWLPLAWYPAMTAAVLWPRATPGLPPDEVALVRAAATAPRTSPGPSLLARLLRPWTLAGLAVLVLVAATLLSGPDGKVHVIALDIGQGDAILVVAPSGATMLIDGGPDPERTLRALGRALPFHRRTIDLLVLTHPHQDHVAGLVDVLDRYRVRAVVDPGRAFDNPTYGRFQADASREPGAVVLIGRAGLTFALDATTTARILYPTEADAAAPLPDDDINNASVVMLLEHGPFRALLTGDAEMPVEATLLARNDLGPVTLLKVGHHGSHSSTSEGLLATAEPMLALISCGIDNDYGHPAPETLAHLAEHGVGVLRTDRDGTSDVSFDGRQVVARAAGVPVAAWPLPMASSAVGAPVPRPSLPATIGAWPFPIATAPRRSWRATRCRRASSSTPAAWRASPRARRASSRRLASPSMPTSSRSPPCSMTSTRSRRAAPASRTASWARAGSPSSATRSSRCRLPRTPSAASSTMSAFHAAGRRCSSRSPTGMSPIAS